MVKNVKNDEKMSKKRLISVLNEGKNSVKSNKMFKLHHKQTISAKTFTAFTNLLHHKIKLLHVITYKVEYMNIMYIIYLFLKKLEQLKCCVYCMKSTQIVTPL